GSSAPQQNPTGTSNPFFPSPGNSTVSPFAIDQIQGIEFYMDRNYVYAYTGGYPKIISYEIWDLIANMSGSQRSIASAIAFNNKFYLAIGDTKDKFGNSITNSVIVYDFILNIWDVYSLTDMPISWCVFVDSNGNEQLLFGDDSGNVYQWNTGSGDNGKPMQTILQTPYYTWGAPEKSKGIDSYSYSTNPGANFQLQYSIDWSNQWQTFSTTSGLGISENASGDMKDFKSISFRIIGMGTPQMTYLGHTLKVKIGTRRNSGKKL
ncbi:MAG: hypothetical protein ACRDFB_10880, partial [Rhabdochlamydiaceae bacterium]